MFLFPVCYNAVYSLAIALHIQHIYFFALQLCNFCYCLIYYVLSAYIDENDTFLWKRRMFSLLVSSTRNEIYARRCFFFFFFRFECMISTTIFIISIFLYFCLFVWLLLVFSSNWWYMSLLLIMRRNKSVWVILSNFEFCIVYLWHDLIVIDRETNAWGSSMWNDPSFNCFCFYFFLSFSFLFSFVNLLFLCVYMTR